MVAERQNNNREEGDSSSGILFCSGMIAGEGLVGILLAILAVVGVADKMDLSAHLSTGIAGGSAFIILMIISVYIAAKKKIV